MPSFHHMALSLNVSLILYSERCLLLNYAIVHQTGGPWNTFGAVLRRNIHLMIFNDSDPDPLIVPTKISHYSLVLIILCLYFGGHDLLCFKCLIE